MTNRYSATSTITGFQQDAFYAFASSSRPEGTDHAHLVLVAAGV